MSKTGGESITAFWRVHWQVLESTLLVRKDSPRQIADSCLASLTQIASLCFEESILVFMGGPRVLFQIKMIKLKHRVLVLGNIVPIRGAVYWQSVCELQRVVVDSETSSTKSLESQVALIQ